PIEKKRSLDPIHARAQQQRPEAQTSEEDREDRRRRRSRRAEDQTQLTQPRDLVDQCRQPRSEKKERDSPGASCRAVRTLAVLLAKSKSRALARSMHAKCVMFVRAGQSNSETTGGGGARVHDRSRARRSEMTMPLNAATPNGPRWKPSLLLTLAVP